MKVQQTTWANVQDAGLSTQAPPIPSSTPEPVEVLTDYTATIILNPTTRELTCSEKIVYTNNSDKEVSEIKLNVFINAFSASATKKPYVPEDEQLFFPLGKDYARIHFSDITALGQMLEFKLTETSLSITLPEVLPPQGSTEITLSFNAYIPLMTARTGADGRGMWFGAFLPTVAVLDKDGWHDEQ
ncbi:MAG: hypothetical protein LBM16_04625, partial [Clostridiales bacterium]|nr:hypothetical protein [Clostridiales bacterium]